MNSTYDHYVFGNKKEIEEYHTIREKGERVKSVTFREEGEEEPVVLEDDFESIIDDSILDAPVHDTGNKLYAVASFFLPPIGLIAGWIFKKYNYIRNFKACRKGALVGFGTIGAILLLFGLLLLLATI